MNKTENKYYTPKIEEFCVGFEYEIKERNERGVNSFYHTISFINPYFEVKKFSTLDNFNYIILNLKEDMIRVKYLCEEDIIESVFKFEEEDSFGQKFFKYKSFELTFYPSSPTLIEIDNSEKPFTKFIGRIKNKTEFKKLLKQLEIDGTD